VENMELKNLILELKALEEQLKDVNYMLISEKRKVRKREYRELKNKILRKLKMIKHLAKEKLLTYNNIFLIDKTSISIVSVKQKKKRYYGNYKINLAIAYNFALGYGFAYANSINQITRKDIETLLKYIKPNCDNPILLTDNRHKYANNVEKAISQTIERLFSRIKKPIYTLLNNGYITSFNDLLKAYKEKLKEFNIIPINF
jgi:hypothetical protein